MELKNSGNEGRGRLLLRVGIPSGFKFQVSSLLLLRY